MTASLANVGAGQASNYYEKDDYYSQKFDLEESRRLFTPYWYGKGTQALGLEGAIQSQTFQQLLEGCSPDGKRLHAKPIDLDHHRAGTDCTLNAPKSVSIAALVQGDDRLVEAHRRAVQFTLNWIEDRCIQARRSNPQTGQREKVCTGNLIVAGFPHQTSRNQDPHLHDHCVILNSTRDRRTWKAVSNELLFKHQKLVSHIYNNQLACEVQCLSYEIERKPQGKFELKGYSQESLKAFSTRRQEIERAVAESGQVPNGKTYQQATLKTRAKKQVLNHDEKRDRWQVTIDQAELQFPSIPLPREIKQDYSPEQLVQQQVDTLLQQEGVFRREKLEQQILETSLGQCRFEAIQTAIDLSPHLVRYGECLTSPERRERLQQLEQHFGLIHHATHEIRQIEEAGRPADSKTDRDLAGDIGSRVAERLAATLRTNRNPRNNAEQIDRCLERLNQPEPATGIDLEAVARGVETIRDRATLRWAGAEVTAALESVADNLRQFERVSERLDQLAQQHRDRIAAKAAEAQRQRQRSASPYLWDMKPIQRQFSESEQTPQLQPQLAETTAPDQKETETLPPLPGSTEWDWAEFVLDYSLRTLEDNQEDWAENDQYRCERDPQLGELWVERKADGHIIAQGRWGAISWDISVAKVEFADWREFIKNQQKQAEHDQAVEQPKSRSQSNPPQPQSKDIDWEL